MNCFPSIPFYASFCLGSLSFSFGKLSRHWQHFFGSFVAFCHRFTKGYNANNNNNNNSNRIDHCSSIINDNKEINNNNNNGFGCRRYKMKRTLETENKRMKCCERWKRMRVNDACVVCLNCMLWSCIESYSYQRWTSLCVSIAHFSSFIVHRWMWYVQKEKKQNIFIFATHREPNVLNIYIPAKKGKTSNQ